MGRRIVIIQGHPDPAGGHFDHAVAQAYRAAAIESGHEVETIEVATLDFALLRSFAEWTEQAPVADIARCQQLIRAADHLVIVFPLWLGTMPAVLKGFLEQVARPGFAFEYGDGSRWARLLKGRSARVVVTMGMPAFLYRGFYGAHSVKALKRNILNFIGIAPVATTIFGLVERDAGRRERFLRRIAKWGRAGR